MANLRANRLLRYISLALAAWCGCWENFAGQQTLLHLRNGDRITGDLIAETPGSLTISNAILGRLQVSVDQIQRRESITNQVVSVRQTNGAGSFSAESHSPNLSPELQRKLNELQGVYVTGQVSAEEYFRQRAKILAEAASVPPVALSGATAVVTPAPGALKPVVTLAKPAAPKRWAGEVFLGTDLAFSQKNRELYTGRLKLSYANAPLKNNLDYLFTYGRTDGEISANRMDGQMKTDMDLKPGCYVYSLAGGGYDEIRKVDWRYEVGPGMGYPLFKRTNFVLRVEGGIHYQVQNFQAGRQDENVYQRLAQDLKWNLGALFTFDEKAEYFPELGDFHVYKFRVEANLRYWLRSNLSLTFTVINTYDTVSASGVGQNDLQVRSSIGMKF